MNIVLSYGGGGLIALLEGFAADYLIPTWNETAYFIQNQAAFPADRLVLPLHKDANFRAVAKSGQPVRRAVLNTREPRGGALSLARKRLFKSLLENPDLRQRALRGETLDPVPLANMADHAWRFDYGAQVATLQQALGAAGRLAVIDLEELKPAGCPQAEAALAALFDDAPERFHLPRAKRNTWATYFLLFYTVTKRPPMPARLGFSAWPQFTANGPWRRIVTWKDITLPETPDSPAEPLDLDVYWLDPGTQSLSSLAIGLIEPTLARYVEKGRPAILGGMKALLQETFTAYQLVDKRFDFAAVEATGWDAFAPNKAALYRLRPDLETAWER